VGETLGFRTVKAVRKPTRCSYCGENIEKGQPCRKWLWVERGDVCDCRMHPECWQAHVDSGEEYFDECGQERPRVVPAAEPGEGCP
jgi:hypothetical protein